MNFRFSKIRYINIYRTTYRRVYSYLQIRAREMYSAETSVSSDVFNKYDFILRIAKQFALICYYIWSLVPFQFFG